MEPDSDDEMTNEVSEQLELSRMDLSSLMSSATVENQQCIEYPKSMEEMLIYFKHYKQQIQQLCLSHNVTVIMGMEKFNLYGTDKRDIQDCFHEMERELFDRLAMINIQLKDRRDLPKYLSSPWRNKLLEEKGCHLTLYSADRLILDSLRQSKTDLEQIKKTISVAYTSKIIIRCPTHKSKMDLARTDYLKQVIEKQKPLMEECKVSIEVSTQNHELFVSGYDVASWSAGKNTGRKMVKQAVGLIFKTKQKISMTKLREYLKEIVKTPWTVDEIEKHRKYVIFTKDSVWQQLLSKESFQKRVGLDSDTVIGILANLRSYNPNSVNTALEAIGKVCEDEGFRRQIETKEVCYIERSDKPLKRYIQFIKNTIEQMGKTFELNKFQLKKLREQIKQIKVGCYKSIKTFYEEAGTVPLKQTAQIREKFGCDLQMVRLLMNQKYEIAYNNMEGTERKDVLFTIEEECNPIKTKQVKIEFQKMTGKYYYGRIKTGEDGAVRWMPDFLIVVM